MNQNDFEQSTARVKREPPVEFVLILPRPTYNWLSVKKEEDVERKWMKSVEVIKFDAKRKRKSKLFGTFLICPHCQLVVKTQGILSRHLKACSKINPTRVECDICGMRFRAKGLIRQHMLKHSSEQKFNCNKCGVGFGTKKGLLQHSRFKRIYKCAVCDVKFSCQLLLKRHQSESHGNNFKCFKCSYQTKLKRNLMNHKRVHDKSIACETCPKKFSTNQSLKLHQMQHRHEIYATAPEETFDCDECDKSYSSLMCLKQHQKHVHDENEVKCEVCDKICKNRSLLLVHSRSHAKVECSICHKEIAKCSIALHMRMHSEKFFECDLCNYSTKRKENLKMHIERMHLLRKLVNDSKHRKEFSDSKLLEKLQRRHGSSATSNEKKFKCDHCGKVFVAPNMLNQHKRRVHVYKLDECEICKKKFRQYQFKSHMKFHSPGNHFECDLCDYKFERKRSLESHIKSRHRNGAFICPFGCRDNFASFHQLIEHRKIHVGKKQWKCTKCDYQTAERHDLLQHMASKKHKMSS